MSFMAGAGWESWGQMTNPRLGAIVGDQSGTAAPGAKTRIRNAGTAAAETTTNDAGRANPLPLLPPGQYVVRAKATGLQNFQHSGILLPVIQPGVAGASLRT